LTDNVPRWSPVVMNEALNPPFPPGKAQDVVSASGLAIGVMAGERAHSPDVPSIERHNLNLHRQGA